VLFPDPSRRRVVAGMIIPAKACRRPEAFQFSVLSEA
jgi:hypothetical protein